MHVGLHVKYSLIFSNFNNTCIFRQIFENFQITNFVKIRLVRADSFQVDRRKAGRT